VQFRQFNYELLLCLIIIFHKVNYWIGMMKAQNPASFQKQGFNNLSMASPFEKGFDEWLSH